MKVQCSLQFSSCMQILICILSPRSFAVGPDVNLELFLPQEISRNPQGVWSLRTVTLTSSRCSWTSQISSLWLVCPGSHFLSMYLTFTVMCALGKCLPLIDFVTGMFHFPVILVRVWFLDCKFPGEELSSFQVAFLLDLSFHRLSHDSSNAPFSLRKSI